MANTVRYLAVDLDGTLIKTDLIAENLLALIKSNPLLIFYLPLALLRHGRAGFKEKLSQFNKNFDPAKLPYREGVISHIEKYRSNGAKVILATASPHTQAQKIADHLKKFDFVVASKDGLNCKGKEKLNQIKALTGNNDIAYIGDSCIDLEVWRSCKEAVVVNPKTYIQKQLRDWNVSQTEITDNRPLWKTMVKALRISHWSKNALIFIPMILAHRFEFSTLVNSVIAFLSFGLAASTVYIFNDLIDVESDRLHPSKRSRPFAAGDLSALTGLVMIPSGLLAALLLAAVLPSRFAAVIFIYLLSNVAYSFYIKKLLMADTVFLSLMYVIRIYAGGYANEIVISSWLAVFSIFFFLSLAMVKRYVEIARLKEGNSTAGRGYYYEDARLIQSFGTSSSLISILVLTLYFSSADIAKLYTYPTRLWLCVPLLVYWTGRLWLIASRLHLNDDPVVFALKDRATRAVCVLLLLVFLVSL